MSTEHTALVVVTVDQRRSRRGPDLVAELLTRLDDDPWRRQQALRFERTAGDEVQGVLSSADAAVDLALELSSSRAWSVGLGGGPVRRPLPASTRAAGGPAFEHAREAVERAKTVPEGVALSGLDTVSAQEAEAVLQLLAAVVRRRSAAGHEVVALVAEGLSQSEVAARLGITKQAVSQRLQAAWWSHDQRVRPIARRLLHEAAVKANA